MTLLPATRRNPLRSKLNHHKNHPRPKLPMQRGVGTFRRPSPFTQPIFRHNVLSKPSPACMLAQLQYDSPIQPTPLPISFLKHLARKHASASVPPLPFWFGLQLTLVTTGFTSTGTKTAETLNAMIDKSCSHHPFLWTSASQRRCFENSTSRRSGQHLPARNEKK